MESVVLLLADPSVRPLAEDDLDRALGALSSAGIPLGTANWLAPAEAVEIEADVSAANGYAAIRPLFKGQAVDIAVIPATDRLKPLFLADMDSTMISIECIDEIADFAGKKEEVAGITVRAMAGELDFEESLRARVKWLRGLTRGALVRVFEERVVPNPGARTLIQTLKAHGVRTVLVSGGFTFFTERVADLLGFDEHRGNTLEFDAQGQMTGHVVEPILGRDAKLQTLLEWRTKLGLAPAQTMAVGDGANDLSMINEAGLGVAYHAKRALAEKAKVKIENTDLTALLYLQGIPRHAFAE